MNRRYPPPYDYDGYYPPHRPEPDDFTPDNIPHHEPPFVPHADWPHNIHPRWNDSEPAIVQPWWRDCCDHGEDDCICVTSADYDRWNTLVDLSALSAFNPDDLSAALSAYERLDNYSALEDAAGCISANSGLWNSAGYVPQIYETLSAIDDILKQKYDISAWSGVYTDPTEIQGTGDPKRPLHLSTQVMELLGAVSASIESGYKSGYLLDTDDYQRFVTDLNAVNHKNVVQDMALSAIYDMLKLLIGDVHEATNQWVLKYNGGTDPTKFYYWDSNDPNWGK
jgi:hypothetical protein